MKLIRILLFLMCLLTTHIVSAESLPHTGSGWFGGPVTSPMVIYLFN